ncbi:MAG: OB-fold nucleic acid binding domain-containing protein, partial [Pseudobdellovibrio sp.]
YAQKRGLVVKPPHVNFSDYLFTVKGEEIYFGLGGIKGVGSAAVEAIIEARNQQPDKKFNSLDEFFEAVDLRRVNKKVIECLIKAGAFDGFEHHRAQLFSGYSKYLDRAIGAQKDKDLGQVSLFDLGDQKETITLEAVRPWSRMQSLSYEKEVLGFFLSDHPLRGFEKLAKVWTTCGVGDLPKLETEADKTQATPPPKEQKWNRFQKDNKRRVIVVGLIIECREMITKKGTRMAFAKVEDLTGTAELVIFPDTFAKCGHYLKEERPLMIGGGLEVSEGNAKIIVDNIAPFEDIMKKTKRVSFRLDKIEMNDFEKLERIFEVFQGDTNVRLVIDYKEKLVEFNTETPVKVQISDAFFEEIHHAFGRTDFIEI